MKSNHNSSHQEISTEAHSLSVQVLRRSRTTVLLLWLMVFLAILVNLLFEFGALDWRKDRLDVITRVEQRDTRWHVKGVIFDDGTPAAGATVLVIASDEKGNQYDFGAVRTGRDGAFATTSDTLTSWVGLDASRGLCRLTVRAHLAGGGQVKKGKAVLSLDGRHYARVVAMSPFEMVAILMIFIVSILLAIVVPDEKPVIRLKYTSSILLAFLFTIMMVLYISLGMRYVNAVASNTGSEIISLGFASVYMGRYVEEESPEWLFSLTAKHLDQDATEGAAAPLEKGFGAPLWVLLVSVLGAGVFTISIIVRGISDPVEKMPPAQVRKRIQAIVLHQFYILFAPLGAIVIYQLIVVVGAASQPVTVGMAVLAAGIGINKVLDKAVRQMESLLGDTHDEAEAVEAAPAMRRQGLEQVSPVHRVVAG